MKFFTFNYDGRFATEGKSGKSGEADSLLYNPEFVEVVQRFFLEKALFCRSALQKASRKLKAEKAKSSKELRIEMQDQSKTSTVVFSKSEALNMIFGQKSGPMTSRASGRRSPNEG